MSFNKFLLQKFNLFTLVVWISTFFKRLSPWHCVVNLLQWRLIQIESLLSIFSVLVRIKSLSVLIRVFIFKGDILMGIITFEWPSLHFYYSLKCNIFYYKTAKSQIWKKSKYEDLSWIAQSKSLFSSFPNKIFNSSSLKYLILDLISVYFMPTNYYLR